MHYWYINTHAPKTGKDICQERTCHVCFEIIVIKAIRIADPSPFIIALLYLRHQFLRFRFMTIYGSVVRSDFFVQNGTLGNIDMSTCLHLDKTGSKLTKSHNGGLSMVLQFFNCESKPFVPCTRVEVPVF